MSQRKTFVVETKSTGTKITLNAADLQNPAFQARRDTTMHDANMRIMLEMQLKMIEDTPDARLVFDEAQMVDMREPFETFAKQTGGTSLVNRYDACFSVAPRPAAAAAPAAPAHRDMSIDDLAQKLNADFQETVKAQKAAGTYTGSEFSISVKKVEAAPQPARQKEKKHVSSASPQSTQRLVRVLVPWVSPPLAPDHQGPSVAPPATHTRRLVPSVVPPLAPKYEKVRLPKVALPSAPAKKEVQKKDKGEASSSPKKTSGTLFAAAPPVDICAIQDEDEAIAALVNKYIPQGACEVFSGENLLPAIKALKDGEKTLSRVVIEVLFARPFIQKLLQASDEAERMEMLSKLSQVKISPKIIQSKSDYAGMVSATFKDCYALTVLKSFSQTLEMQIILHDLTASDTSQEDIDKVLLPIKERFINGINELSPMAKMLIAQHKELLSKGINSTCDVEPDHYDINLRDELKELKRASSKTSNPR